MRRGRRRSTGHRMGKLTTHVLDTAQGIPGRGIEVRVYRAGLQRDLVAAATTNDDGRVGHPLLEGDAFLPGTYELEFNVGEYFDRQGVPCGTPPFLGTVILRVTLSERSHYHVPLLVSPWSYSTYRGS